MKDLSLLLDEEDYQTAVDDLIAFADKYEIEYDGSSRNLIEIATTVIMAVDLSPAEVVMTMRVIYNIGYRDNEFRNSLIH